MTETQRQEAAFFWIGLFGIIATGALAAIGWDNYWGLGRGFWFTPPNLNGKYLALLGVAAFLVALSDLVAIGVVFAGIVILLLRGRGRV